MDKYANYSALSRSEIEGHDYRVHLRLGASPFALVAPHGGRIERGTLQIARAVAGSEHTFYGFEGIKSQNNHHLHITSDHFDEPRALAAAGRVQTVVSIHGARGKEVGVYLGGLDHRLRAHLIAALRDAGFEAAPDPSPARQGTGKTNICNRGQSGRGVQFELPVGMRKQLFDPIAPQIWVPNALFLRFVGVMREALEHYLRL